MSIASDKPDATAFHAVVAGRMAPAILFVEGYHGIATRPGFSQVYLTKCRRPQQERGEHLAQSERSGTLSRRRAGRARLGAVAAPRDVDTCPLLTRNAGPGRRPARLVEPNIVESGWFWPTPSRRLKLMNAIYVRIRAVSITIEGRIPIGPRPARSHIEMNERRTLGFGRREEPGSLGAPGHRPATRSPARKPAERRGFRFAPPARSATIFDSLNDPGAHRDGWAAAVVRRREEGRGDDDHRAEAAPDP